MKRDSRVGPVSLCNVEVVCVRGGQVQPSLASPMTTGGAAEQGEAWHTIVCVCFGVLMTRLRLCVFEAAKPSRAQLAR